MRQNRYRGEAADPCSGSRERARKSAAGSTALLHEFGNSLCSSSKSVNSAPPRCVGGDLSRRAATIRTLASTAVQQHVGAWPEPDLGRCPGRRRHALFMQCRGGSHNNVPLLHHTHRLPRDAASATRDRGAAACVGLGAREQAGGGDGWGGNKNSRVCQDGRRRRVRTMPVPGAARWRQQPAVCSWEPQALFGVGCWAGGQAGDGEAATAMRCDAMRCDAMHRCR